MRVPAMDAAVPTKKLRKAPTMGLDQRAGKHQTHWSKSYKGEAFLTFDG